MCIEKSLAATKLNGIQSAGTPYFWKEIPTEPSSRHLVMHQRYAFSGQRLTLSLQLRFSRGAQTVLQNLQVQRKEF